MWGYPVWAIAVRAGRHAVGGQQCLLLNVGGYFMQGFFHLRNEQKAHHQHLGPLVVGVLCQAYPAVVYQMFEVVTNVCVNCIVFSHIYQSKLSPAKVAGYRARAWRIGMIVDNFSTKKIFNDFNSRCAKSL